MSIKERIKRILFGYNVAQEYVCVNNHLDAPFQVLLSTESIKNPIDVTDHHVLVGYKPLIIGIFAGDIVEPKQLQRSGNIQLSFKSESSTIATLVLKPVLSSQEHETKLSLFVGEHGQHKFLSHWHQLTNRLKERSKLFSVGNVFLPMNLYEQVRIAYAVPRQIAIVTLGENDAFNMFPTDLHGQAGENFYISSLRKGGKACEQVMRYRNVCIASVPLSMKDTAYRLGKNHMKDTGVLPERDLDNRKSQRFILPLPNGVISYFELTWFHFVDIGIHRVFFYKVIHTEHVRDADSVLHHIHRFCLQWRLNHGLNTDFQLRNR